MMARILWLGELAIALKVKVQTLESGYDSRDAVATPLNRLDLVVEAFHETVLRRSMK
jgi:hypothetical protein